MSDFFSQLENAAFDSYDAEGYDAEGYDADNATGPRPGGMVRHNRGLTPSAAIKRSPAQMPKGAIVAANNFTINIVNDDTIADTVQLFYAQNSVAKVSNPELSNHVPILSGAVLSIPNFTDPATVLVAYGRKGTDLAGKTGVYWNAAGDMVYITDNGSTTISCNEIPFRTLVEFTQSNPILIQRIRMTVTNSNQFNNSFSFVQRNIFGKAQTNVLAPNNFFSPDQFQSQKLDINTPIRIDKEKGWNYVVNAGVTVQMVMSIGFYGKSLI